ncbi:hypothetical protein PHLCEN_2v3697 [Hermanssonia centrifuga]|uniref:Saccharopine dehydrogenase NADP binding domain-containing protein n=1 Tax=Hermanssonia centrifuga TaxID=98765 RepID=A0A2R6QEC9_9APHY|nr:hypothetical protein PHLCEN_2v3697 [Hermanssonia centrifuga]
MVDILVLGATGYTGRLIARYLNAHPERSSFTFGIAGRSKSKLASLKQELNLGDSVQVFHVDVTKQSDVDEVVKATKVVINTVGPYWRWGTPVVKACAEQGKHYVDLAGEQHWIQDIIIELDYLASKTHAIIVPASGFDSVPSDLAVHLSNKTLKALSGSDTDIEESVSAFKLAGTISGGTVQSILSAVTEVPREKMRIAMLDHALSTALKGPRSPPPKLWYTLPFSYPTIYGGLFMMASGNKAIVQRSWGLNENRSTNPETVSQDARIHAYGPKFKYTEFMVMPGKLSSIMLSLGLALSMVCLLIPPFRWLFTKLMPQSGEGPTERQLKDGYFHLTNVTSSVASPSKPQTHVRTVVHGQGDPGYLLTSIMIAESALAILLSHSELPQAAQEGGVLTPSTALGDVLLKRLESTGRFTFESEVIIRGDETND